jgi:hypothetical protein
VIYYFFWVGVSKVETLLYDGQARLAERESFVLDAVDQLLLPPVSDTLGFDLHIN